MSRGKRADFSKLLITQSERWGSEAPLAPRQDGHRQAPAASAPVPGILQSLLAGVGRGAPALRYNHMQAAQAIPAWLRNPDLGEGGPGLPLPPSAQPQACRRPQGSCKLQEQ